MGRLFVRVFLWFWLGSTCLVLVLAVSLVMAQPEGMTTWRAIGRTGMRYAGSHVANEYEREGSAAAQAAIARASREGRFRAWLYTRDGRFVAGPSPVANSQEVIERGLATEGGERVASGDAVLLAERASSDSGAPYVVMWEAPRPLRWSSQVSPYRFSSRVAALILTGGAVCWLLTWQITRPIRALREAARRFAAGDLSVRVSGSPALRRRDELAELAREFDQMAGQIQELMTSKQQVLADISHELRSPLARLSLALDLARRRLGEDVPEHQRIDREVHLLDELIGQLLTLARLQAVTGGPKFEEVDLRALVREVAKDARFEAEAAGRAVVLEREVDATATGNPALLRSAIENVVRNAVRHTPEHTTVSISLERQEAAGGRLVVSVRDRGPGVPPQALARLFDPFFRVEDSRDRASGGAGLGLAIALQAMVAHGGGATAENHPEGGLLVRLTLPAA